MIPRSSEVRSSETRTMGGAIDKDAKALTVVPCGRSPSIAVTTETGVQTAAITSFSDAAMSSCGVVEHVVMFFLLATSADVVDESSDAGDVDGQHFPGL